MLSLTDDESLFTAQSQSSKDLLEVLRPGLVGRVQRVVPRRVLLLLLAERGLAGGLVALAAAAAPAAAHAGLALVEVGARRGGCLRAIQ